jgi:hypothetical protein
VMNVTASTARQPGARYFLPTLDEWMKAVHFDPAKQNTDGSTGGWWQFGNRSDTRFIYGPPGAIIDGQPATTNAGWISNDFGGIMPERIPVGSYPTVTSPWGLLDVSGGGNEWMETIVSVDSLFGPLFDGSHLGGGSDPAGLDSIRGVGGESSIDGVFFGRSVRIGMVIPAPSVGFIFLFGACAGCRRNRRA